MPEVTRNGSQHGSKRHEPYANAGIHVSAETADVASAGAVITKCLSDIEAKPVSWLWPGRIPRGKLTIIAGNPGVGKSQITACIAGVITTGKRWPVDQQSCTRGAVLFLSAEDDPADTLRPRLEAVEANLQRVHVVEGVIRAYTGDGRREDRMFCLQKDLQALDRKLTELRDVVALIVDPISAYLGDTDSHKNGEVRGLLAPLAELAARHHAAIIGVTHLPKAGGTQALMRIIGSVAFAAATRAAYLVTADPEDTTRRLFLPTKNNLGPESAGLSFRIEAATVLSATGPIETSRIVWEPEPVSITADEAIRATDGGQKSPSVLDSAKHWLREVLGDGPVGAGELLAKARIEGVSEKTLRRASKALNVEKSKAGMDGGWCWSLSSKVPKAAQDAQGSDVATFGEIGHLHENETP